MISCEEFEKRYPEDQSFEVLAHLERCPYCIHYSTEIAELVSLTNALPNFSAPIGFEYRLEQRLNPAKSNSGTRQFIPRFAAFASGAALMLIVGAVYNSMKTGNNEISAVNPPVVGEFAAADTLIEEAVQDSIPKSTPNPWINYWNMETVSVNP